jgi:ketosteroid isomerase-like protein
MSATESQAAVARRNVEIIRTLFANMKAGDIDGVLGAMSDDTVVRVPGRTPLSGNHHGNEGVRDLFANLAALTGGSIEIWVDDVVADDRHGAVFGRMKARRGEMSIESETVVACTLNEEGYLSEVWFLYSDQRAYDEFFG